MCGSVGGDSVVERWQPSDVPEQRDRGSITRGISLGLSGLLACADFHPSAVALLGIHQKLNAVQIKRAMANDCANSNPLLPVRGKKFDVNFRTHGKIRDGKQAHPNVAEIDAESIHVGRSGEYLHGSVQ